MLHLTENAAMTLQAARFEQQIPQTYGVRVSGAPTSAGGLEVQIGFAEAPLESDAVSEEHGTKLFVAAEVVEPLADAELDATVSVSSNGQAPVELVLRPQQHPDEV